MTKDVKIQLAWIADFLNPRKPVIPGKIRLHGFSNRQKLITLT